jgi:hypothetical protein
VFGTAIIFTTTRTEDAVLSNTLLNMAFLLTVAYLVVLPLAATVGLPRIGVDWDPTDYGFGTWIVLVVAVLWYATVFVIPLAIIAFVFALPSG